MEHLLRTALAVDYSLLLAVVLCLAAVVGAGLAVARRVGFDPDPTTVAIGLTFPPYVVSVVTGHTALEPLLALTLFYGAVGGLQAGERPVADPDPID